MCGRECDRDGRHICSECMMRLPLLENRPEDFSDIENPAFDRAASALRFEGVARKMVLDFKFNRHIWMRDDFVDCLEGALHVRYDVEQVDCVVPVPANILHRIDRGYDQVDILARPLAKRIGRRYLPHTLVRAVTAVRRQSSLGEAERFENASEGYRVRRSEYVAGRTVLLVDDIVTTGATLSACARALKECGVWRVWTVSLARSVRS